MIDTLSALDRLDWDDLEAVTVASAATLEELSVKPGLLVEYLDRVAQDERLRALCEHYDILDKVVLHNDPNDAYRIRLHVFRPGYFDRPHNHRWAYTSRVLEGSYRHYIYGAESALDPKNTLLALQPQMIRTERVGSSYTLHHSVIHAVVAEPWTISLIVRGPARSDRFLVMDRLTGECWWQYGARDESAEEQANKRMTDAQFAEVAALLHKRLVQASSV